MQLNFDAYQPRALKPLKGETANSQLSNCAFKCNNSIGLTQHWRMKNV